MACMPLTAGSWCGRPEAVTLADGATVQIRAALPGDEARLRRMFYRLSPNSIYFWMFVPAPKQPYWAANLARLAQVDYTDQYALVALVGGEIVGIARYDRGAAPEEAEFAIVIEDAWQARGLGKLLMRRLIAEADQQHISTFTARILGENRRALRLIGALFAQVQSHYLSGECLVRSPLTALRGGK